MYTKLRNPKVERNTIRSVIIDLNHDTSRNAISMIQGDKRRKAFTQGNSYPRVDGNDSNSSYYVAVTFYLRAEHNDLAQEEMLRKSNSSYKVRLLDWLTRWLEFRHCEITFPIEKCRHLIKNSERKAEAYNATPDKVYAYGAMEGLGVFGKPRTFSTPNYQWIYIMLTRTNLERMVRFCESQVGKKLDVSGPFRSVLWPKVSDGETWYCAEFVVVALQQGGVLRGLNPATITIDEIFHALDKNDQTRLMNGMKSPFELETIGDAIKYLDEENDGSNQRHKGRNENLKGKHHATLRDAVGDMENRLFMKLNEKIRVDKRKRNKRKEPPRHSLIDIV